MRDLRGLRMVTIAITVLLAAATVGATKLQKKVAGDEKGTSDARATLEKATYDLNTAVSQKNNAFENAADTKAAVKAVAGAQAQLKPAREAVMDKLKTNPNYASLITRENSAQANVDAMKAANGDPAAIEAASQDAARIGASATALERDALDHDANFKAANDRLVAANTALQKMKDDFAQSLTNDPNLASLRKAKEDAELKVSEADAKLRSDASLLKHK